MENRFKANNKTCHASPSPARDDNRRRPVTKHSSLHRQQELLPVTCLITAFKNALLFLMRRHFSPLSRLFAKGQKGAFTLRLLQPRAAGAALNTAKAASPEAASETFAGLRNSLLGVIPAGFLDVAVTEFHREELLKSIFLFLFFF